MSSRWPCSPGWVAAPACPRPSAPLSSASREDEETLMQRVEVHRFPTSSPDDISGLAGALDTGTIDPASVIAVLGKTEGNGCVNDFTRGFATMSYAGLLATRLRASVAEVTQRVQFIMSG